MAIDRDIFFSWEGEMEKKGESKLGNLQDPFGVCIFDEVDGIEKGDHSHGNPDSHHIPSQSLPIVIPVRQC